MLFSLSEQANKRKSHLSALREKRKLEIPTNSDNIAQESTFKTSDEAEAHHSASHDEQTSSSEHTKSRNFDRQTMEAVSGVSKPPTLEISNSETVEVLASQIQEKILHDIGQRSGDASTVESPEYDLDGKHEPAYYNKDLKADLAYYLNKADFKTEQALNRVLQDKYQNSLR